MTFTCNQPWRIITNTLRRSSPVGRAPLADRRWTGRFSRCPPTRWRQRRSRCRRRIHGRFIWTRTCGRRRESIARRAPGRQKLLLSSRWRIRGRILGRRRQMKRRIRRKKKKIRVGMGLQRGRRSLSRVLVGWELRWRSREIPRQRARMWWMRRYGHFLCISADMTSKVEMKLLLLMMRLLLYQQYHHHHHHRRGQNI